jgi:hypothetical protein
MPDQFDEVSKVRRAGNIKSALQTYTRFHREIFVLRFDFLSSFPVS